MFGLSLTLANPELPAPRVNKRSLNHREGEAPAEPFVFLLLNFRKVAQLLERLTDGLDILQRHIRSALGVEN